ncbi:hypothetical protein ABEB36_014944 [Hypothenemus hampei]|uniref:Myb/SANT-like DNA-binding domain-containing protein n=1 Tax=Hypothenemus hampei TaxID=57062 RepID=A0ABD1E1L9_HYPHA
MYNQKCGIELHFRINDEIIAIEIPEEEKEIANNIENNNQYAKDYILRLINNGFVSLEKELEKIYRIDDGQRETLIFATEKFKENNLMDKKEKEESNCKWSNECTMFLIDLVQQHNEDFQKKPKNIVWKKICEKINNKHQTTWTPIQVDSKWKGLKRTYHEVKRHNNTSGNNIRKWNFFDKINDVLFNKPEINPPATCSSFKGLVVRDKENTCNVEKTSEESSSNSSSVQKYTSSFSNKRKSTAEKRHNEKMQRVDKYLELFERLVTAVEKK